MYRRAVYLCIIEKKKLAPYKHHCLIPDQRAMRGCCLQNTRPKTKKHTFTGLARPDPKKDLDTPNER
jgi:hypothetical protein